LGVIGGDGTFTGANFFSKEFEIPIIGIPGTIDNDLYGSDYTIGYDTANNTVIEAIDKIRDTAASHERLFFVEVMGRDSGCIALNAGIAGGAEAILLPEKETAIDDLIRHLEDGAIKKKSSSIVIDWALLLSMNYWQEIQESLLDSVVMKSRQLQLKKQSAIRKLNLALIYWKWLRFYNHKLNRHDSSSI